MCPFSVSKALGVFYFILILIFLLVMSNPRNSRRSRRNNNRRIRRRPFSNLMFNGTMRAIQFEAKYPRALLSVSAAGVNANLFTVTNLIGLDLATRLVKPVSIIVRFHPYNLATSGASHFSAQLEYSDVNSGILVPFSNEVPLSSTNIVTLTANFPIVSDWLISSSTTPILNIPVWAQTLLATGLYADIQMIWAVAQDNLN
jgi:hypothetical protein